MQDEFENVFGTKQKILVVLGHPDDLEVYAGGTIARLITLGKEVRSVKVTMGDKGSQQKEISQKELSEIRLKEDTASMSSLGIMPQNNVYLRFEDGTVENTLSIIKAITEQIRTFQPDIIITHNPDDTIIRFGKDVNWVNHRDHRNTGKSTIDATYPYSRDILFFPEQLQKEGPLSHICKELLLVDYYSGEDIVSFDVTDFIEKRVTAHASHASQYTREQAQDSADFFTKIEGTKKRFERFQYVIID